MGKKSFPNPEKRYLENIHIIDFNIWLKQRSKLVFSSTFTGDVSALTSLA